MPWSAMFSDLWRKADAESLNKSLEPRESSLVSLEDNLVDSVWADERPTRPKNKVFPLDTTFSGKRPNSLRYHNWLSADISFL